MKHVIRTLLLMALGCMTAAAATSAEPTPPLAVTTWEITERAAGPPDNAAPVRWRAVSVPGPLRGEAGTDGGLSRRVLRGTVSIEGNPAAYAGLYLGRVYHDVSVSVNGTLLQGSRPGGMCMLHSLRSITLPPGLLRKGPNTISISLGIIPGETGGLRSAVTLLNEIDFTAKKRLSIFLFSMLPFGILFLCGGIIVLLLSFFAATRELKVLYSALGLLMYIVLIVILFFPWPPGILPCTTILNIQAAALTAAPPLFTALLVLIVQSLYGIFLAPATRAAVPAFAAAGVTAAIFELQGYAAAARAIEWLSVAAGLIIFPRLLVSLHRVRGDRLRLRLMAALLVPAWAVMAFEVALHEAGLCLQGLASVYTAPLIIAIFMVLYLTDYVRTRVELARLYDGLAARAPAFASGGDDRPVITDSAEEKLKRVIAFIEEHYTSALSREGLAAAVDLNPSYMGRLFMTYTGKRIGDFVNDLRVSDAIRRMNAPEVRVLDIALVVGFESLSTFNRAFRRVTGTSPTEYRREREQ